MPRAERVGLLDVLHDLSPTTMSIEASRQRDRARDRARVLLDTRCVALDAAVRHAASGEIKRPVLDLADAYVEWLLRPETDGNERGGRSGT